MVRRDCGFLFEVGRSFGPRVAEAGDRFGGLLLSWFSDLELIGPEGCKFSSEACRTYVDCEFLRMKTSLGAGR